MLLTHAWPGFLLLALALAASLWHQIATGNYLLTDSSEYLAAAAWLWKPVPQSFGPYEIISKRLLAYPLLISLTAFKIPLLLAVQALLVLLNAALLVLGLRRFVPPRVLRWVPALVAIFPQQYMYAGMVMSEVLLQTSLMIALFSALYYTINKPPFWWWQGAAWALAVLTKPALLYLVIFLCGLGLVYAWQERQAVYRWAMLACLLPLAAIGAQTVRVWQVTGYAHYSAIKEVNLLYYNAYYLLQRENPARADSLILAWRNTAEQQPSFGARQEYMQARALEVMQDHPLAYTRMHLAGMGHYFLDPGRFDLYNFFRLEAPGSDQGFLYHYSQGGYRQVMAYLGSQPVWPLIILALNLIINLLMLLFVTVFLRRPYPWWYKAAFLLPVVYLALITGPLGAARFRMPVSLHLLGMALLATAAPAPKLQKVKPFTYFKAVPN